MIRRLGQECPSYCAAAIAPGARESRPRRGRRANEHFRPKRLAGAVLSCYIPRFEVDGAVAQLGERQNRTLEVEGSIPFRSTIPRMASPCSSWQAMRGMTLTNVVRKGHNKKVLRQLPHGRHR